VRDLLELAVPPGNHLNAYGAIEWANIVFESMTSIVYVFTGRMDMQNKLKSRTITRLRSNRGKQLPFPVVRRLPVKRPPTHPGEMLLEEFLKPLGISQSALAVRLGISFPRLNEIIRGKRRVTSDTALRLAQVVGMSADFWLGLQQDWELWHALRSKKAAAIARLAPLRRVS
jgi:antitoxin HigA-1